MTNLDREGSLQVTHPLNGLPKLLVVLLLQLHEVSPVAPKLDLVSVALLKLTQTINVLIVIQSNNCDKLLSS